MTLSGLLCCPQNDSVTVGFLSATSDIDLQLLQDFDLSEFEGLFGQSEDNNDDNNNSSTGGGGGAAEGAPQATPTQPESTNQEAENAEQPSEEQQVKKKKNPPQLLQTARCTGSRALTQFHLRPAGGGGATGGEAQRLRHSAVRHQQDLRDEVRQVSEAPQLPINYWEFGAPLW